VLVQYQKIFSISIFPESMDQMLIMAKTQN